MIHHASIFCKPTEPKSSNFLQESPSSGDSSDVNFEEIYATGQSSSSSSSSSHRTDPKKLRRGSTSSSSGNDSSYNGMKKTWTINPMSPVRLGNIADASPDGDGSDGDAAQKKPIGTPPSAELVRTPLKKKDSNPYPRCTICCDDLDGKEEISGWCSDCARAHQIDNESPPPEENLGLEALSPDNGPPSNPSTGVTNCSPEGLKAAQPSNLSNLVDFNDNSGFHIQ
jgi:hypothetical protein